MKYLCLGYYDPDVFDALSADEKEALAEQCAPHDEELRATGRLHTVASLEHRTAKVLRPEDGETTVTDGPFAETRELIGSYFIVEADDLEEAVEIASLHPAARLGEEVGFAVEVHPIDRMAEAGA
jgi:hypothetical protein